MHIVGTGTKLHPQHGQQLCGINVAAWYGLVIIEVVIGITVVDTPKRCSEVRQSIRSG